MRFSQNGVIEKEREMLEVNKKTKDAGVVGRLFGAIVDMKKVKYTFQFNVPQYFYIRALSFCRDVSDDVGSSFGIEDLSEILFIDFLEYMQEGVDVKWIHEQLSGTDLISDKVEGVKTRKKVRDHETIKVKLEHRDALKGEFLLHDMLEVFPEHEYRLESILEFVFCDFIDRCRKGEVKKPIAVITQYIV